MLTKRFFDRLGKKVLKMYKYHIFDRGIDVRENKFRKYSEPYGSLKRANKLKGQWAGSVNLKAPVVTEAFKNIYNRRVSVVFSTKKDENLPKVFTYDGTEYDIIDGDLDDKQFLHGHNVVIGLRLKGDAQIKKFNHLSYLDSIGLRKYDNINSFVWKV